MESYTLAIDLGTSGPKVALVSARGDVPACEVEETKLLLSPGGGAEQDPEDWWKAIRKATHRLLEKKHASPDHIHAVCCSTQWSGTVAVDASGKALMNAVIWMDSRGADHVGRITDGWVKFEGYGLTKLITWLRLTGGIPSRSGKDSIAHILYIKNTLPEIYKNTYKFLEPKDYLNLLLTGRFACSQDSIALHWVTDNRDINNIKYHPRLLKFSTVDPEKFPEIKRSVDVLGPLLPGPAKELGIPAGIPVVMGTPDLQSAALGSGAVRDYEGHLYIGTSSWLTCHVPFKKTDVLHNMATLPSAIPGRYFIANEQETAGYCLTWLRDKVFFPRDGISDEKPPADAYVRFNKAAESVPAGSGGLIFTPWLYGERTPVEDHTVRGGFFNQSLDNGRPEMIRAVFEGVAYNSRWLLKYVEKFIHRKMETINMIGGGARSDLWCQIHADVLGRTIRQVAKPVEANARGAGFLAAVALGHTTWEEVSARIEISRTFHPNPENATLYDEMFQAFLNIYEKNKGMYRRLNGRHRSKS